MEILFTLLSVLYIFRSVQIGLVIWRSWPQLKSKSFPPQQKSLAGQASFFIAVPIAVLIHEGAHALAVTAFGGQIIEFNYRFFMGSVLHQGPYSPAQSWFISLAGTLGSLATGMALWLIFRRNRSPTFRYFGLRSFRFQILFSLIIYPLMTLMGFYGDWRTIYDFAATPLLSGATVVFHAVSLALFFWVDRRGYFQMASFESEAERERLSTLETQAPASRYDTKSQLELIDTYRRGGETKKAKQLINQFLKNNPNSAEGYLQLAAIETQGKAQIPRSARNNAAKALSLGLSNPAQIAAANQLLGQYSLGVDKYDEAITYFDRGLAAAQRGNEPRQTAKLHYMAAVTYRRGKQYELAYRDIQQAIKLAQAAGQEQAVAHYQSELETIELHAGRSFK
jgi:hypothetical protein